MKKTKKLAVLILVIVIGVLATGCGSKEKEDEGTTIKVGVVGEANEMWEPVIEKLKEEGVTIELVVFTDYTTPNKALNDGDTDLNAFQHYAYFESEIKDNGYKLTAIGDTFISAMNIYSNEVKDVSEIKKGDKIAVPNDATNEGRALKILEAAELIKLDPDAGDTPEKADIIENPLELELVEVDAANVYALLPDVAAAVINCNYALDNGVNPGEDAIFEDNVSIYAGNTYVNLIAAREEDKDNETYKKIVEAYQSEEVKAVYADAFKGAYLPAWEK